MDICVNGSGYDRDNIDDSEFSEYKAALANPVTSLRSE